MDKGDVAYCKEHAYLEDATARLSMGPAAGEFAELTGIREKQVVRGNTMICLFWQESIEKLGLNSFEAYEDKGKFSTNALVLDDNTVISNGKYVFNVFGGEIFSEMWVRVGSEWKMRSQVLSIEEANPELMPQVAARLRGAQQGAAPSAAAAAPAASESSSESSSLSKVVGAVGSLEAGVAKVLSKAAPATVAVATEVAKEEKEKPAKTAAESGKEAAGEGIGSSAPALMGLAVVGAAVVFVLRRRASKRQTFNINNGSNGYDGMLG